MNLWFLSNDEDCDGELFVRCDTVEEAIDAWRRHFADAEYERYVEYGYGDDERGRTERQCEAWLKSALPDQIWLAHPTNVGALGWHNEGGMKAIRTSRYHAIEEAKKALGVKTDE